MGNYITDVIDDYNPSLEEPIFNSFILFFQDAILDSILKTFDLEFLIFKDKDGGNVDTVHNVRIGVWQNEEAKKEYEDRGGYDKNKYHRYENYNKKNKVISEQRKNGTLYDAYTGEHLLDKVDLDHVVSAKEIHDDPGRFLSGLRGEELANRDSNLQPTSRSINRSKRADSMSDYIEKKKEKIAPDVQSRMMECDNIARSGINHEINRTYYTSMAFWGSLTQTSLISAAKMGGRRAFGVAFIEILRCVRSEFSCVNDCSIPSLLCSIANGFRNGLDAVMRRYCDIIADSVSGVLSNIVTTLINVFITTFADTVKIIRNITTYVVSALKVLLFNPQNLPFTARLREAMKILAAGTSALIGNVVRMKISKVVCSLGDIGDALSDFCAHFCSFLVNAFLMLFIERGGFFDKMVYWLRTLSVDNTIEYYREQAEYFEKYAADLLDYDLEAFRQDVMCYSQFADKISIIPDDRELNVALKEFLHSRGIVMSWEKTHDDFDAFMKDKNARMSFE
ncbi:MAG: hypothetical protein IJM59_00765 [Proteobacteria bacterium]|nr:hypothetical protein [Pseudomonadota bacterium]